MKITLKEILQGSSIQESLSESVDHINSFIERERDKDPDKVRKFLKEQYEIINGAHYNDTLAQRVVDDMWHGDTRGEMIRIEDVERRHDDKNTLYDAYVGYNATAHMLVDLRMDKEAVMKIAEKMWFGDDDFTASDEKVWRWINAS